jgi:hypothetical protein
MHLLLASALEAACCMDIFSLGLLAVAWWFRGVEPDRWRRMSARRAENAALGLIGIGGTAALVWLAAPANRTILLGFLVIPPSLGALVMGIFWGRLNHAEGAPPLRSNSR